MPDTSTSLRDDLTTDGLPILRLENAHLRVDVSPRTGGRITSLVNKAKGLDLLWKNEGLALAQPPPGAAYDPNFYGGIDEVIPGDLPERIGELDNPDHGELWTLPLAHRLEGAALALHGRLPTWGLDDQRRMSLRPDAPWLDLDYRIENRSGARRVFLWKLHAALAISPGDEVICPAEWAAAADVAWSRWGTAEPFPWPQGHGQRADRIPPRDGSTDFLFLYGLRAGQLTLRRPGLGVDFSIAFDPRVFPYVCYFASYGGFDNHYTAVLEPCTAMPLSVNEAARLGQCSALEPGEVLTTRISLYAGPIQEKV